MAGRISLLHAFSTSSCAALWLFFSANIWAQSNIEAEQLEFFEKQIRPILVDRCYECHASNTETSGGLNLDSRDAIMRGGDSGAAIKVRTPEESLLFRAVEYQDPKLQMPPDGKLSQSQIEALRTWILSGAPDPRDDPLPREGSKKSKAISVENALEHWAYRPIGSPSIPLLLEHSENQSLNPIDRFIEDQAASQSLTLSPAAANRSIARRLYNDLIGLPPTADQLEWVELSWKSDDDYAKYVDNLLTSPRYGERFARRWMDIVRYAESLTLRGFILNDVWRYRNYLIDSFNDDTPYDRFIVEQIAGDLLPASSVRDAQRQLVATTMLAIGDNNFEEQDKLQLEMDYVDEQLDVVGKVFLAQTLGCARCHDHKFDPIPTRDYYALAGIMKSSIAMDHENVSKWVRLPLPLASEQELRYQNLEKELAQWKQQLANLKKTMAANSSGGSNIFSSSLNGIVVDNIHAKLVGEWQESVSNKPFVDAGYLHDKNSLKGTKSATFEPADLPPGNYQLRFAYTHGDNRSSKTLVRVFSADGEKEIVVNQKKPASDDGVWQTLGRFRFEANGQAFVLVSNEGSDGHVIVDAIQFLPDGQEASRANEKQPKSLFEANEKQSKEMETRIAVLQRELTERPMVQTLRPSKTPADIPIHIRGSVYRLGSSVPRGYLSCIDQHTQSLQGKYPIAADANGRLELARWIADENNPLTARVYVNRVWAWLMGAGLVSTVDNFGTTGEHPSHPELLDWLVRDFVASGWSTKHLVRQIVTSQAYRRSVVPVTDNRERDPMNRLFTRANLRRLDAETLRDSMLMISGELEFNGLPNSTIRSEAKDDYQYRHESNVRSVYLPWFRNSLPELVREMDGANPCFSIAQRPRSTVATQALSLLNSDWVHRRASAIEKRLSCSEPRDIPETIRHYFRAILSREPTADELKWGQSLGEENRWAELAHHLIVSLDFRFID